MLPAPQILQQTDSTAHSVPCERGVWVHSPTVRSFAAQRHHCSLHVGRGGEVRDGGMELEHQALVWGTAVGCAAAGQPPPNQGACRTCGSPAAFARGKAGEKWEKRQLSG